MNALLHCLSVLNCDLLRKKKTVDKVARDIAIGAKTFDFPSNPSFVDNRVRNNFLKKKVEIEFFCILLQLSVVASDFSFGNLGLKNKLCCWSE